MFYREVLVGVFNLFSKRQKRARGELPDVYVCELGQSNLPA